MSGCKAIIVVAGPTATGKSKLAMDLALRINGAVINADSMQVYRDLRVLTARPSRTEMAGVPHHLYGILSATEPCSAARWRDLAEGQLASCIDRGQVPILVGGTGLYLRALLDGLAPVPDVPRSTRVEAERLFDTIGATAFHDQLRSRDPKMAGRLKPRDRQRLIRAWEVVTATGRSLADWQTLPHSPPYPAPHFKIVLRLERTALYEACDRRFETMMAAGALDEVRALERRGLDPRLPAMKALGVPSLRRHLHGAIDLETAVNRAKRATRHYAKRQTTWFRHQMNAELVLSDIDDDNVHVAVDASRSFLARERTAK